LHAKPNTFDGILGAKNERKVSEGRKTGNVEIFWGVDA